jgi:pseudouridine-5'-phosphate glycosidase
LNPLLHCASEVSRALAEARPVVALESTVISHGLRWPQNLATALAIEAAVQEAGVVPATVAVLDGKLKAGLSEAELEHLARLGPAAEKCSSRDLPFVLQSGRTGATTVAATLRVAAMAGIRVFATGGIGGVHRGAERSFDISADLQELARTPVAVVSAGPKAILDLSLTSEYLETHGVPVIGYQTDQLPAFYTRQSGIAVNQRLDHPGEIAAVLRLHWQLGLFGVLVANPVPEEMALQRGEIDQAIVAATLEAQQAGFSGKQLTPWLLSRLEQLTEGRSVQANVALIVNNARLGAEIAVALSRRQ